MICDICELVVEHPPDAQPCSSPGDREDRGLSGPRQAPDIFFYLAAWFLRPTQWSQWRMIETALFPGGSQRPSSGRR